MGRGVSFEPPSRLSVFRGARLREPPRCVNSFVCALHPLRGGVGVMVGPYVAAACRLPYRQVLDLCQGCFYRSATKEDWVRFIPRGAGSVIARLACQKSSGILVWAGGWCTLRLLTTMVRGALPTQPLTSGPYPYSPLQLPRRDWQEGPPAPKPMVCPWGQGRVGSRRSAKNVPNAVLFIAQNAFKRGVVTSTVFSSGRGRIQGFTGRSVVVALCSMRWILCRPVWQACMTLA